MKSLSLVIFIIALSIQVYSQDQIKQGVYSLGGSFSFSSISSDSPVSNFDETLFNIAPTFSYFVIDNIELTSGVGYTHQSIKSNNLSTEFNFKGIQLDLGIRMYYPLGTSAPFIGTFGNIMWDGPSGENYSKPISRYSFIGGVDNFIHEVVALEPAIIFTNHRYSDQFSTTEYRFGLGVKYFIK